MKTRLLLIVIFSLLCSVVQAESYNIVFINKANQSLTINYKYCQYQDGEINPKLCTTELGSVQVRSGNSHSFNVEQNFSWGYTALVPNSVSFSMTDGKQYLVYFKTLFGIPLLDVNKPKVLLFDMLDQEKAVFCHYVNW